MTMIIHQELCQELRSKSLRGAKQEKLAGLILQAVADFQLTPCKMHIISILFYLAGTDKFKILFFHFYQWILLYPIYILESPFLCIFFIAGYTIGFAHRSKPFVTV